MYLKTQTWGGTNKEEKVAGAKLSDNRTMRLIIGVFAVFALGGAMMACGGDETPQPRQFGGDDDASPAEEPTLPGEVDSVVKLSFRKNRFEVEVTSDRLYCLDARGGEIFEKPRRGKSTKVASFKTDDTGVDSVKVKKPGGNYFARMDKADFAKYGQVSVCSGHQSKNIRV